MSPSRTPFRACLLALALAPLRALAQDAPDLGQRRQLVDQALAARGRGDHANALALFVRAGEIQMRPGLRMSIAQEEQSLGRGLASCESASLCVVEVQADLASPESARVMQGCAALVAASCAPLGRVQVTVPAGAPSELQLQVAGRPLALRGPTATTYAEPGDALVRALLGAREVFSRTVSVQRGTLATVTLELPNDLVAATTAAVPAPRPVVTPHPAPATPAPTPPAAITSRWWFWTGLSVLVLGGAVGGLAAGGAFDRPAPPVGGTAYTVEALYTR